MLTFYKIDAKHAHHRSPPQYINTSQYIQQRPNTIYRIGCQLLRIANTNIYRDTSVLIPSLIYHKPTLSLMPLYGGCCWFGVRFCERRCDFAALCSLRVQCSATTACKRSRLTSSTKTFSSKRLLTPSTTHKGREGQRTVTV